MGILGFYLNRKMTLEVRQTGKEKGELQPNLFQESTAFLGLFHSDFFCKSLELVSDHAHVSL